MELYLLYNYIYYISIYSLLEVYYCGISLLSYNYKWILSASERRFVDDN